MNSYVVITPARDEEQHMRTTIECMVQQTLRPARWIIVNDGSRDGTGAIISEYSSTYPWIVPVHVENRGFRQPGGGVVAAFYSGYKLVGTDSWDFIVKFDADLSFSPDYFARCLEFFEADSQLGIGGGAIYHDVDGHRELEPNPLFHVRGATKIYRRQCWEQLGGLLQSPGWDTLDELKANMLGWRTRTFDDIHVLHQRFTGAAEGTWKDSIKNGQANYIAGYHPLFMLVKCVRRLFHRPYLIGSAGLLWGFLRSYLRRVPRVPDQLLIQYTRSQQIRRLLFLDSIWK